MIPCKKSRYLLIPDGCDIINVSGARFQHFKENQNIPSAHNILYNFVPLQTGLIFTMYCLKLQFPKSEGFQWTS
ncbi:MAG TPA: hypothetical protein DCY53_15620 [Desulfobacteraceae bacterium]|nr:hypothetical protein [Desulfobacteraceae bacterium]